MIGPRVWQGLSVPKTSFFFYTTDTYIGTFNGARRRKMPFEDENK